MNFWNYIKHMPPQLITVLLLFGIPTVARILKKLGEQSQKRDAALKRERDEGERLRTGRNPIADTPTAAPSARATLEEMAAKRRAEIEELRQRRQAQVTTQDEQRHRDRAAAPGDDGRAPDHGPAPGPAARPPAPDPGPSECPAQVASTPAAPARADPRERARQQALTRERAEQDRLQRAKDVTDQERQRRSRAQQRDRAPRMHQGEAVSTTMVVTTPELAAMAKHDPTLTVDRPIRDRLIFAKGDWRKAFIMQELLSRPLSER